jgi:formyl-CoA transferase
MADTPMPLAGLKVIELGTLIAGPYCARLLAEFGAEVIKVETPGEGDPLRKWRKLHEGNSLWWYAQARNKKSVAVNLKDPEGRRSCAGSRRSRHRGRELPPGHAGEVGPGLRAARARNPGLIMVRLSGSARPDPTSDQPGLRRHRRVDGRHALHHRVPRPRAGARRHLIGDSLAAMFGVIGALMAMHHRTQSGRGQVVDVRLYEAVFAMMESMLPEYGMGGSCASAAARRSRASCPPTPIRCKDGTYVVIGANADSIFKRMMRAIGRADLADDPSLATQRRAVQAHARSSTA